MASSPTTHHRRSIRLQGYDYSQPGEYFVTVCTHNKGCLFGDIIEGQMRLKAAGQMVHATWYELPQCYPMAEVDAFIVMPNHVHGVIRIVGAAAARQHVGAGLAPPKARGAASSAPTLGDIVRGFESISAIAVNRRVERVGQALWQRNYYEHIIRTEEELNNIREYILTNPLRWHSDRDNPDAVADSDDALPWNL